MTAKASSSSVNRCIGKLVKYIYLAGLFLPLLIGLVSWFIFLIRGVDVVPLTSVILMAIPLTIPVFIPYLLLAILVKVRFSKTNLEKTAYPRKWFYTFSGALMGMVLAETVTLFPIILGGITRTI